MYKIVLVTVPGLYRDSKSKQCPHCKTDVKPIAVQLRLQMDRMPLALLTSVSKMSFPAKGKKSAASKHDEEPPKVSHKLPNGKVISSARLGLLHNSFGFLQFVFAANHNQGCF